MKGHPFKRQNNHIEFNSETSKEISKKHYHIIFKQQMTNYVIDHYQKGIDAEADVNTCYDKPGKKQKHPHYEHRLNKALKKNNEFSLKKFQKIRHVSNQKKNHKAIKRIARCLNHVSRDDMPKNGYDKVCLVLINNVDHEKHDPKIGAFNDGYLFALYHHRLGFKCFYLYNCIQGNYPKYLKFFLNHTTEYLTVFYSGPDSTNGLVFRDDKVVTPAELSYIISRDNNGKSKVVFVSDCTSGGTPYDISEVMTLDNPCPSPMLSFSVNKFTDPNSKEGRRSHGILTYYFCKAIYDNPDISAKRIVERLNSFMSRFSYSIKCDATTPEEMDKPIYDPSPSHPDDQPDEDYIQTNIAESSGKSDEYSDE